MPRTSSRLSPPEAIVTDTMGRLVEFWGLRRNLGRGWAVLYLEGRPLTAQDLQTRLRLSSGAVSMTLRELQRWGVVRRVWLPGERRKLYEAEVDVWRVLSRLMRQRGLTELEGAVDALEGALADLRRRAESAEGEGQSMLEAKVAKVALLLDLTRMLTSMIRSFITTGRLDATVLSAFRLGRSGPEG